MRVISNRRLVEFSSLHPDAAVPLQAWRKIIEGSEFKSFAGFRASFNSVDVVGEYHVFNIKGNNFRLVCGIIFASQVCYVKHVLTHADYDRGKWK